LRKRGVLRVGVPGLAMGVWVLMNFVGLSTGDLLLENIRYRDLFMIEGVTLTAKICSSDHPRLGILARAAFNTRMN
jgi:hypothetical protein